MTAGDDYLAAWCLGVAIAASCIGLFSVIVIACEKNHREEKDSRGFTSTVCYPRTFRQKCFYWFFGVLSATFWLYGSFIIYGFYTAGSKIISAINYLERTEQVIPKSPKTIDLNKAEKP